MTFRWRYYTDRTLTQSRQIMLLVTCMTNIHLFPDEGVDATSLPQAPEPLIVRGGK